VPEATLQNFSPLLIADSPPKLVNQSGYQYAQNDGQSKAEWFNDQRAQSCLDGE
jgi:hypothetical protein